MRFDPSLLKKWLQNTSVALPGLERVLRSTSSEVMVIGAGVFDLYVDQGWIPKFNRKTGDLDLSVGLRTGESDYQVLVDELISKRYVRDERVHYRFHSPVRIAGGMTYIDLLAHPAADPISAERAKLVMGVGPDFSFSSMAFARLEAFPLTKKAVFPNPLGALALKREAYLNDPAGRLKDLGDIAELAWGIIEKGTHFEMSDLWKSLRRRPEAQLVRKTLLDLGGGESVQLDLENVRQELLKRNFSASEIDEDIPARLIEWAKSLEE